MLKVVCLSLFLFSTVSVAQVWEGVGANAPNVFLIDTHSIKLDKSSGKKRTQMWMRMIVLKDKNEKADVHSTKSLLIFDCERATWDIRASYSFNKVGELLASSASPIDAMIDIVPGSLSQNMFDVACDQSKRNEAIATWRKLFEKMPHVMVE